MAEKNTRGQMRPNGTSRSPPFLVIGLIVVIAVLGFNYWSVSSDYRALSDEHSEQGVRCRAEKEAWLKKDKKTVEDFSNLQSKTNQLQQEVTNKGAEIENLRKTEGEAKALADSFKSQLDITESEHETCKQQKGQFEVDINNIRSENDKVKDELLTMQKALKDANDKLTASKSCADEVRTSQVALINKVLSLTTDRQLAQSLQNQGVDMTGVQVPEANKPQDQANQQQQQQQQPAAAQKQDSDVQDRFDRRPPDDKSPYNVVAPAGDKQPMWDKTLRASRQTGVRQPVKPWQAVQVAQVGQDQGQQNPGQQNPGQQTQFGQNPGQQAQDGQNPGQQARVGQNAGQQAQDGQKPGQQAQVEQNLGQQAQDGQKPDQQAQFGQNTGQQIPGQQNPGQQAQVGQNPGQMQDGKMGDVNPKDQPKDQVAAPAVGEQRSPTVAPGVDNAQDPPKEDEEAKAPEEQRPENIEQEQKRPQEKEVKKEDATTTPMGDIEKEDAENADGNLPADEAADEEEGEDADAEGDRDISLKVDNNQEEKL